MSLQRRYQFLALLLRKPTVAMQIKEGQSKEGKKRSVKFKDKKRPKEGIGKSSDDATNMTGDKRKLASARKTKDIGKSKGGNSRKPTEWNSKEGNSKGSNSKGTAGGTKMTVQPALMGPVLKLV